MIELVVTLIVLCLVGSYIAWRRSRTTISVDFGITEWIGRDVIVGDETLRVIGATDTTLTVTRAKEAKDDED